MNKLWRGKTERAYNSETLLRKFRLPFVELLELGVLDLQPTGPG